MFQQRHFEAIARLMQETKPHESADDRLYQWKATQRALVSLFNRENSRFDDGRFERACEPGANVRSRKVA